jgi:hypothetical protein
MNNRPGAESASCKLTKDKKRPWSPTPSAPGVVVICTFSAIEKCAGHALRVHEASDFLLLTNHEGECLDFHSLRHTCGAWHALAGEHPKVVQTIMRHSQITLTMDTYGHLFPGQAAEAVGRFGHMLGANA